MWIENVRGNRLNEPDPLKIFPEAEIGDINLTPSRPASTNLAARLGENELRGNRFLARKELFDCVVTILLVVGQDAHDHLRLLPDLANPADVVASGWRRGGKGR